MEDSIQTRVPKWPFFLGDAVMLGLAFFIYWQGSTPLPVGDIVAGGLCVALGALLGVTPFVLEHRIALKTMELASLDGAMEKIQNLETLSAHIGSATSHWQMAHENAEKTSEVAREITDRISTELKDLKEFLQTANDNEKSTLRLETDKLRRAEADWLQTVMRMLDHVFALHLAAERSRQPQLVGQIGGFQNACRESARKVGLVPFAAAPAEKFDPKRHQVAGGDQPVEGAPIIETIATGYTFQGRQIRHALVKLVSSTRETSAPADAPSVQSRLAVETAQTSSNP